MTNLVKPGDSAADNEWLQKAESHKYDSSLICTIAEIAPGVFALYQFAKVGYVGDWSGVLEAYQLRPAYHNRPHTPRANGTRRAGKISAEQKAANTANLLALMKGAKSS